MSLRQQTAPLALAKTCSARLKLLKINIWTRTKPHVFKTKLEGSNTRPSNVVTSRAFQRRPPNTHLLGSGRGRGVLHHLVWPGHPGSCPFAVTGLTCPECVTSPDRWHQGTDWARNKNFQRPSFTKQRLGVFLRTCLKAAIQELYQAFPESLGAQKWAKPQISVLRELTAVWKGKETTGHFFFKFDLQCVNFYYKGKRLGYTCIQSFLYSFPLWLITG